MIPPLPNHIIAEMRKRTQPPVPSFLIANFQARQQVWFQDEYGRLWYWAPAANICGKGPDDWVCLNA